MGVSLNDHAALDAQTRMHPQQRFERRFRRRVRAAFGVGKTANGSENVEMRVTCAARAGEIGAFGLGNWRQAGFFQDVFSGVRLKANITEPFMAPEP